MKQQSPRTKFYIALAAVVGGLLALVGVFSFLLLDQIFPLSGDFASAQRDILISESKIDYLKKVIEPGVERSDADLKVVQSAFYSLSFDDARKAILFVESTGKANNVSAKVTLPPSGTSQTVSAQASGKFSDIIKFIRALENGERLVRIGSISLQGSGGDMSASLTFFLQTL